MTPAEIAAYIGALAWLPHIGSWIYRTFITPKLRLSCAPTAEVGYTTLGPIVNINLAISTERRDALIERIRLKLTHEKGETRSLIWTTLSEAEQDTLGGSKRTQPATALKVGEFFLAEKQIGFRDHEFQTKWKQLETKLADHYRHLKSTQNPTVSIPSGSFGVDLLATVTKSKEFSELRDFFHNYMYWKEGKYTFEFSLEETHLKSPHKETFTAELTKSNIDTLKGNFALGDEWIKAILSAAEGKTDIQAPQIWFWAYPEIHRVE